MEFGNLASAYRRANHFASIQFAGPFSILASTGPAVAARNYCMLLDADIDERMAEFAARSNGNTVDTKYLASAQSGNDDLDAIRGYVTPLNNVHLEDLVLLDRWAAAINRYCDNNLIANDELAKEAFACFASRMWIDPRKL